MRPDSLTVFFPMYNERENIGALLEHVEAVLPRLGLSDFEILIIDDGSKDGCDRIVEAWQQRNGSIRLVRHEKNLGYGSALRTGFQSGSKNAVFYSDSDLPADLMLLKEAIALLDEADLVVGYRIKRHETLRRAIYSKVYNRLMRWLFGVRARDVNFSFKLVSRKVLDRIRLTAGTVFIDGQLLAEAHKHGFKMAEIAVDYTPRKSGRSNFDSLRTAWDTLAEMVRYRLVDFRKGRRP